MPKRGPKQETYESDGGFVDDAPKSKKLKKEAKNAGPPPSSSLGQKKEDKEGAYWEVRPQLIY